VSNPGGGEQAGGRNLKRSTRSNLIRGEASWIVAHILKTAAGLGALTATGALSTPAISQRAAARVLRFVPHADLANFDPIWTNAYVARICRSLSLGHAGTAWTTNCSRGDKWWNRRTYRRTALPGRSGLRAGLKFHDGEPVLAKDAVTSINRWAVREPMGQLIKAIESELAVVDDRTFRWVLTKPFPKMLLALGKTNTPCC